MKKELTFESANKQLEEIIAKMEKGDVELEESMKLYEEACILLSFCTKKLEECKGQIHDINERIKKENNNVNLFED